MDASPNRPTIASCLIAAGLVAYLVSSAGLAQTRINDATGRTIEVPATVDRVYAAGPPASVLLLAVAPEKLIGWTRAPRPDEAAFLPDQLVALPELGRLTGRGNTANVEVVMAAKPDLILDVGSIAATFVTLAVRVQEQTGVPYLLFDGSLRDTPRLLRQVGGAVGKSEVAEALANEADRQIREVTTRVAGIPETERPRVYFARGPTGLTTAPRGSMQAEALELAGGYNVIAPPPAFEGNLVNVSLEDVLLARPEIIIASDPAFAAEVRSSPGWKDVPAVRNGRIYAVPGVPFGWFDSPPSLNRLLGMHWLARVFYPKLFPESLGSKIKAFHSQYYHREPTDEQVRALLATAGIAE